MMGAIKKHMAKEEAEDTVKHDKITTLGSWGLEEMLLLWTLRLAQCWV